MWSKTVNALKNALARDGRPIRTLVVSPPRRVQPSVPCRPANREPYTLVVLPETGERLTSNRFKAIRFVREQSVNVIAGTRPPKTVIVMPGVNLQRVTGHGSLDGLLRARQLTWGDEAVFVDLSGTSRR